MCSQLWSGEPWARKQVGQVQPWALGQLLVLGIVFKGVRCWSVQRQQAQPLCPGSLHKVIGRPRLVPPGLRAQRALPPSPSQRQQQGGFRRCPWPCPSFPAPGRVAGFCSPVSCSLGFLCSLQGCWGRILLSLAGTCGCRTAGT